ncbi:hypothetical protein PFISCL1PPCAC_1288, partial [Pristionchus fissidentatus]
AGVLGCTNIVLLSDHGMRNIKKLVNLQDIDPVYADALTSTGNNVLFYTNISSEPMKCKKSEYYRVYQRKDDVPLRYHYDHANVGFPYVNGNPGTMFVRNNTELADSESKNQKGNHGWDNMDTQMQAMFYTVGPSIRQNVTVPPFQNVNLYNLFADLMRIRPAPNNGTTGLLDALLVDAPQRENPFTNWNVEPCHRVTFENCDSSGQVPSVSDTKGYILTNDPSVCSISDGKLFLLYSTRLNQTVGMEMRVGKSTESSEDRVITKMNNEIIGRNCEDDGGRSAFMGKALESSLKLTWNEFDSQSLVQKAVNKLTEKENVRLQIGFVYAEEGPTKYVFVSGFWCLNQGWRKDNDYCVNEIDTRVESYAIPARAVDNFNCLDDDSLLFDYRVTIGDIEKLTSLSLLPKSMPLSIRNKLSQYLPTQEF